MRILLTGGTGFLGRHLIPMMSEHEVFALTRGRHGGRKWPGNVTWFEANLSAGLDTARLPKKMDAIIHLAQSDRFREFPGGAGDMFRVNVEAPAALMRWAVGAGVTRAVFASTGTVYEPFTGLMREDDAINPTGYYGASKLATETLTLAYQKELAVAQLRVFFLYGPGQEQMMMARLINSVRKGETLTLPRTGDGLVFVPTYVTDTARVFKQAAEEAWRGAWNVASPRAVSMAGVFDAIGRASGLAPKIERIDAALPQAIVPNLDKIRGMVDIDAFQTLDQGLAAIVAAGG